LEEGARVAARARHAAGHFVQGDIALQPANAVREEEGRGRERRGGEGRGGEGRGGGSERAAVYLIKNCEHANADV
jgi:hypothetical protein